MNDAPAPVREPSDEARSSAVATDVQRGLMYEAGLKLEAEINRRLKTTAATRIHVVFVPAGRDELYPWLVDGRGDLVA